MKSNGRPGPGTASRAEAGQYTDEEAIAMTVSQLYRIGNESDGTPNTIKNQYRRVVWLVQYVLLAT